MLKYCELTFNKHKLYQKDERKLAAQTQEITSSLTTFSRIIKNGCGIHQLQHTTMSAVEISQTFAINKRKYSRKNDLHSLTAASSILCIVE